MLTNAKIIMGNGKIIKDGSILVENGRIKGLYEKSDKHSVCQTIIDAQGKTAGPGLIDMHIHGCGGYNIELAAHMPSTESATHMAKTLSGMTAFLRSRGVTSFQLTMITDIAILSSVQVALSLAKQRTDCLEHWTDALLGIYPEGPFINLSKKGGLLAESIEPFTPEYLEKLLSFTHPYTGRPLITTMVTAPELPRADELYTMLKSAGIKTAWGHSDAYIDDLPIREGVHLTHLFNAMNGLDHKRAGLATLPFLKNYSDATFELICDTVHVNPSMLELIFSTLGTERICLISDGMSQAGMEASGFNYVGQEAVNDGITCRFKETGVLIGSAMLSPDTARGLFTQGLIDAEGFFRIAAVNPARVLNLKDRGILEEGKRADIVLVDDGMNITDVFCT